MTELEMLVLNSVKKKHSCLEIMKLYNLTVEQLWNILLSLKNKGFSILRKYYYNGDLVYEFDKLIKENHEYNNKIIMGKNDSTFTAILIADTHIGGDNENLKALDLVYNLCTNLGIHIIIHCGDFIDSFINGKNVDNFIGSQFEQIDRALKLYPCDPEILNFICLGNHDMYALSKGNQNLALAFENRRHDLIPIGWNSGRIQVKKDKILVGHKVNKKFPYENDESVIVMGHKHLLGYEFNKGKAIINVPAIVGFRKAILKLNLKLEKGYFTSGVIEEFTLGEGYNLSGLIKSNEIKFELEKESEARKRILK